MASTTMPSYSDLMRLGRVHVMDRVAEQTRQSLPIPVRLAGALQIAFFFAPAQVMPGRNRLAPPNFIAWLDPRDGTLVRSARVTARDFGQAHEPGDMIGEFRLVEGMTANQYLAEREQLFGLYANVVPPWMAGDSPSAAQRMLAQEFLKKFGLVSEPPLIPYYHAVGKEFFDWVRAAARG